MKRTVKIVMALLALALAFSCFGLFAFADGGAADHAAVLEYFEQPVFYDLPFSYESTDAAAADLAGKVSGADENPVVTDVSDGTVTFNTAQSSVTFGASLDSETAYHIAFRAKLITSGKRQAAEIQFRFTYADESGDNLVTPLKLSMDKNKATATFADKTWYVVDAVFTPAEEGYTLSISVKNDEGVAVDLGEAAAMEIPGGITSFRVIAMNVPQTNVAFDSISAYAGSFSRKVSDFADEVDPMLVDLLASYKASSDADEQLAILETVNRVVSPAVHAYVPTSDEAKAAVAEMQQALVPIYAAKLVENVSGIDAAGDYADRVALVDVMAVYDAVVPADYSGENASAVLAAKAAFASENQTLATFKSQSEGFIASLEGLDIENGNFAHLKSYYEAASSFVPYASYEGVAAAQEIYTALSAKYLGLKSASDIFKLQAALAADTTKTIGDRYVAFESATANYFDDTSCSGIAEALAQYASVEEELNAIAETTREFIDEVAKAQSSTYYTAIVMYLDRAEAKMAAAEPTFPGVAEAKETYAALRSAIAEQKTAVDAYIAAVDAIDVENMTFMQLKAAVDAALALQEKGDVTGYEGVSEANVKLSNAESIVKTPSGYSETLLSAMSALAAAANLSDRRAALLVAIGVRDLAEANYEGVPAALTALDAAIASYNADVAALNASYEEAAAVAVEATAAAAPQAVVYQIVAILKKVFAI